MSKTVSPIRQYFSEVLTKVQIDVVIQSMRDNRIAERTIKYDLDGGNTPPWRRLMWAKSVSSLISFGDEDALSIIELKMFPDKYLERTTEPVDHELNDIAS